MITQAPAENESLLLSRIEVGEKVRLGAHKDISCKAVLTTHKVKAARCPMRNVHDNLHITFSMRLALQAPDLGWCGLPAGCNKLQANFTYLHEILGGRAKCTTKSTQG